MRRRASEEPPPVTVLKSGVVDGMAYSLYSDGSIEAQMPEGMMRFASIDELRSHLDQRPSLLRNLPLNKTRRNGVVLSAGSNPPILASKDRSSKDFRP